MSRRIVQCLIPLAAAVALQSPAHATFHEMQIEQIVGSVNGDVTAQAIQLRMRANGQNFVSQAKLVVVDAQGQNPVTILNIGSDVSNGAMGSRVLIASDTFSSHTTPQAIPDFLMTNVIPESYLTAGSLMFQSDGGTVYWRLSWGGSNYTGSNSGSMTNDADGNFGPPIADRLPSCNSYVLRFKNAANAKSTNNKADYAFKLNLSQAFVNNAGTAYTLTGTKPTINVSVTDGNFSEVPNSDTAKIKFKRTGCTQLPLPVKYVTQGTATNGVDYQMLSGSATIAVGSANKEVTIKAIDDNIQEANETATLKVSNNANYTVGNPNQGSATLHSNE